MFKDCVAKLRNNWLQAKKLFYPLWQELFKFYAFLYKD